MPAHVFRGRDFNEINFDFPVVSGPYRLGAHRENVSLSLARRPDWWAAARPANAGLYNFDELLFRFSGSQDNAFDAFRKGLLDVYPVYSASIWVREARGDRIDRNWIVRRAVRNQKPVGFQGFALNLRRAPYDDPRVRRALAHTLDREGFNLLEQDFEVSETATEPTVVSVTLTEKTRQPYALTATVMHDALTGRNDIFVEGRKVSGYARRVSKQQEIIHGTLMYDVDIDTLTHVLDTPGSKLNAKGIGSVKSRVANLKDYLPGFKSLDEVQAALQDILANGDHQMELTESQLNEVRIMAETKFSTWDFIYGRSRQADLVRKAKLPCGTVEAAISLDRGLITRISFSGDFMFDEPPTELESVLTGCRFERAAIVELSSSLSIPKHFKGATINDFLGLLFE